MPNYKKNAVKASNPDSQCQWAIMIYMAADDAVAIPEALKFLAELHEISSLITGEPSERKIRILLQAYSDWDTKSGEDFHARRFEIDSEFSLDNQDHDIKDYQPMGTSEALSDFINWCKDRCKAENYLLFLWGHGTGSGMFHKELKKSYYLLCKDYPSFSMTDIASGRAIKNINELTKKDSSFFRNKNKINIKITFKDPRNNLNISDTITITRRITEFYKKGKPIRVFDLLPASNGSQNLSMESNRLRKYLSTRSSLDALLEGEIRESLKNNNVDILLIMGCCMQMVEFAYEIRENKGYLIASEELIYFHGYNYLDSFSVLAEFPDMDARQFAKRIVQETPIKETYTTFEKQSLAISCVDLAKSDLLVKHIHSFTKKVMRNQSRDLWNKIKEARGNCRHFGEDAYTYSFIDITWFFKKLYDLLIVDNKYKDGQLCMQVKRIISFMQTNYIIENWIGSERTPSLQHPRSYGGHGVGIYFPDSLQAHRNNEELGVFFDRKNTLYANEFTRKNKWNEMIFNYMKKSPKQIPYPLIGSLNPMPLDKRKNTFAVENHRLKRILVNLLLKKQALIKNRQTLIHQ